MKNTINILIFVFALSISAQAQRTNRGQIAEKMTPEQLTTLAAKKLTLQLDLTAAQTKKVSAIYLKIANDRAEMASKRKAENDATKAEMFKIKKESKDQAEYKANLAKAIKEGKIKRSDFRANNRKLDFNTANKALDAQIAFQNEMKTILSPEQFVKFKKIQQSKKRSIKDKLAKHKKNTSRKKFAMVNKARKNRK